MKMFASLAVVAAMLVTAAGYAMSGESLPPLLCDASVKAAPVNTGACPPPPPACAPAPVACAPAPACPTPAAGVCQYKEVKVKQVVNEVRTVPVQRRVYVDEVYTATEKRTETHYQVEQRTAVRKVPREEFREKREAVYARVQGSGNAPRLARGVKARMVPVTVYDREEYQETYTRPVKTTVEVPVVKTRRVATTVEDVKTVTVPVTVVTTEMRPVR